MCIGTDRTARVGAWSLSALVPALASDSSSARRMAGVALRALCCLILLRPAPVLAAQQTVTDNRATRFEMQRRLGDLDERRKRIELQIAPLDSEARVLGADVERLKAVTRSSEADRILERFVAVAMPAARQRISRGPRVDSVMQAYEAVHEATTESLIAAVRSRRALSVAALRRSGLSIVDPFDTTALVHKYADTEPGTFTAAVTAADIDQVKQLGSADGFANFRRQIIQALEGRANELRQQAAPLYADTAALRKMADSLSKEIGAREDNQTQLDTRLINVALPIFGVAMIVLLVAPRLYKNEELQRSIFASGILLELTTVFLLTVTVLILGLGEKIRGEVIGTLLGGISGYVLGRSVNRKAEPERREGG